MNRPTVCCALYEDYSWWPSGDQMDCRFPLSSFIDSSLSQLHFCNEGDVILRRDVMDITPHSSVIHFQLMPRQAVVTQAFLGSSHSLQVGCCDLNISWFFSVPAGKYPYYESVLNEVIAPSSLILSTIMPSTLYSLWNWYWRWSSRLWHCVTM